jgi:hypothetical protein
MKPKDPVGTRKGFLRRLPFLIHSSISPLSLSRSLSIQLSVGFFYCKFYFTISATAVNTFVCSASLQSLTKQNRKKKEAKKKNS